MILRLLLTAGLALLVGYGVWRLRPHPLSRTPRHWKALESASAEFRRGLTYRREAADLLITGRVVVGEALLTEVDLMLEQLASWVILRSKVTTEEIKTRLTLDAEIQGTLKALEQSRDALLAVAHSELRLQVDALQLQLRAQRESLNDVVTSHEELSQILQDA